MIKDATKEIKATDQSFGNSDPASDKGATIGPRGSSISNWTQSTKEKGILKVNTSVSHRTNSIVESELSKWQNKILQDEYIRSQIEQILYNK